MLALQHNRTLRCGQPPDYLEIGEASIFVEIIKDRIDERTYLGKTSENGSYGPEQDQLPQPSKRELWTRKPVGQQFASLSVPSSHAQEHSPRAVSRGECAYLILGK